MKKLMILFLVISLSIFLVEVSYAGYYLTIEAYVEDIASNPDGSISIHFSGGQDNRPGHGACKDSWVTFPVSENTPEALSRHLALALYARTTGKRVIVYGSQPDCSYGNRIALLRY